MQVDNVLEQLGSLTKGKNIKAELMTFTTFDGRKKEVNLDTPEEAIALPDIVLSRTRAPESNQSPKQSGETWEYYSTKFLNTVLDAKKKLASETLESCQA